MATAVLRPPRTDRQSAQTGGNSSGMMAPSSGAVATAAFEMQQPLISSHSKADGEGTANNSSSSNSHGSKLLASSLSPDFDRHSHPLVIESPAAFKALLVAPLVIWWLAVGTGIAVYEGLPKGQRIRHVMTWFDRGVLRPAGALVPFVVLVLRAAVHAASHFWRHGWSGALNGSSRVAPRLRLGSLLLDCMVVYFVMAVFRILIYLIHYHLITERYLEFHIVSDHIFLAATMLICLHTELLCLASDMLRTVKASFAAAAAAAANSRQGQQRQQQQQVQVSGRELALTALFVVATFLYLFTAADMYYTAKYFHFPLESFTTAVMVFFVFQLPMLAWLNRMRRSGG